MKLLILLFLTTVAYASNYPSFTKHELQNIKKHSGIIAKNRALDYEKTINSFKNLPKKQQLIRVNAYLNQLLPQADYLNYQSIDYWGTPKEFLTIGYGDCEDYAIIKYYTLLKLGFKKNKLFITTAYEKFTQRHHMVLSYFESFDKPPLILDNLSFRILDLQTREDLQIEKFINYQGVFRLNEKNKLIWIAGSYKKFENLVKKVNKES